ncbi:MAG: T9SS type A sorting domain-containing protein [Hymenobacter sp.]|nr:MAG: T9SS type A sorting domain-containing protein [Hymenobacter sp.]
MQLLDNSKRKQHSFQPSYSFMRQTYNLLVLFTLLLIGSKARAQYTFEDNKLGPYLQPFDAMGTGNVPFASDGTSASLPGIMVGYNWGGYFVRVPDLVANNGSTSTSAAYNFGTTGAADRALGGIAGGLNGNSGIGYISVRLRNNSSKLIKNLDVRYAIEQWFNSSQASDAWFRAAYRVYRGTGAAFNKNDIVQATGSNGWTAASALNLQAPATGGVLGQVDGNSTTYRRAAQSRLQGVNLASGDEIVIRFDYVFNSATNGNGISLDDIVIYPETDILYSKSTGSLDNTATGAAATWSLTTDGNTPVGAAIDFSAPNVTYYVQGTNTASRLSGSWQVTGAGSRVVVGTDASPATLYLAPGDQLAATVDVASGSALTLGGTPADLTLGTLAAGSTVRYTGNVSGATQVVLPATYAQLSLSGRSLKSLANHAAVAEILAFTSASSAAPQALQLGEYNLTLLRNATLSRTKGGQVITNGTGEYRATVLGAGSSSVPVTFPVALSAAASDYVPVAITAGINSAGNDKDETYRVRAISGVYTTYSSAGIGATASASRGNVNTTWHIGHETATPVSATLQVCWATGREGNQFARASSYLDHYTSTTNTWDAVTAGSSYQAAISDGMWAVQRTGVSKFSPFTVNSSVAGPLPVTLVAFAAKRLGSTVACAWATANEQHNDHFVVERSLEGTSFQELGTVAGHGTSPTAQNYTFVDERPAAGVTYYRLRQVDTDGTATYSPVAVVQGGEVVGAPAITAAPNPSTGRFALLTNFSAAAQVRGSVVNMLGQPVATVEALVPGGAASLPLDLSAQPAGVYLVQLHGPAGPVSLRLLKQ